jgi:hypothetical protein
VPTSVHYGPIRPTFANLTDGAYVLRDLVLVPTAPGQTALDLTWPGDDESCINRTCVLENITTAPGNGYFWESHILLRNAWNARVVGCNTIGPSGMPDPVSMNGIVLDGKSTGVVISGHRASGLATAIWIKGEAEGTKIDDLDAVGVCNGIVAAPDTGGGEPGLWITNTHINATQWGIHLTNRYQVFLSNLLLYGGHYYQTTGQHPFYGVVVDGCQEVHCQNVKVGQAGDVGGKSIVPFVYTAGTTGSGRPERLQW